jgi:hypothetical protein
MKKLVLILTIALVGVAAWSQSSSSDEEKWLKFEKEQLAGLTGGFVVRVLVNPDSDPDSLASLLPISSIQTDVELKLRIAHITVLTEAQLLESGKANAGVGSINVDVLGVHNPSVPIWAISISVLCGQKAQLARNPSIGTIGLAAAYNNVFMFRDDTVSLAREQIKDLIDKLLNLYLAANP